MRLLALLFVLFLSSPVTALAQEWRQWKSEHYLGHPLVGMIHMPGSKAKFDPSEKGQKFRLDFAKLSLSRFKYILLGENHDNIDHHRIQAWMIDQSVKTERRPTVVFEMIPRSYSSEVSEYNLETDPQLNDFAKRLEWETRGWYEWSIYRPVALAAAQNELRMFAGNLDLNTTRNLSKNGMEALSPDERKRFGLEFDYSPEQLSSLSKELKTSHCGMMSDAALPRMSLVQRARDGSLAEAMIATGFKYGSILIAGNGHVRKDRGVPRLLRAFKPGFTEESVVLKQNGQDVTYKMRTPNAHSLAVGLIEVVPGKNAPGDYELTNEQGEALYDFVIFTPKTNITDHCAAMREHFKAKKKKQP